MQRFVSKTRWLFFVIIIALIFASCNNEISFYVEDLPSGPDLSMNLPAPEVMYRIFPNSAIQYSPNSGMTWKNVSYTFSDTSEHFRGFTWHPERPKTVALHSDTEILISSDAGSTWTTVDTKSAIHSNTYISALSFDDQGNLIAGTTFTGAFQSSPPWKEWERIVGKRDPDSYQGAGFYDEITEIAFAENHSIIFTNAFGNGFFEKEIAQETEQEIAQDSSAQANFQYEKTKQSMALPFVENQSALKIQRSRKYGISFSPGSQAYQEKSNGTIFTIAPESGTITTTAGPTRPTGNVPRQDVAKSKDGFYVAPIWVKKANRGNFIALTKKLGLNSITIDLKDDNGMLTYDSRLPWPKQIGAVREDFILEDALRDFHEAGLYVVARVVVFKDPKFYRADNYANALWDSVTNSPWGINRVDRWVDPFSRETWKYNIEIALELEKRGVDEIQFDYIRFPSDGNTGTIVARHRTGEASRISALEGFLKNARFNISIPISIDVFGFNGWTRMNYLGQDIERLAKYVDVICPMFYPSHFPADFYPEMSLFERAQWIYNEGTRRNKIIAGGNTIIRPWVQSFLLGDEREFEQPQYWEYFDRQVTGTKNGGGEGMTLWNASGNYYMVSRNFRERH